MSEDGSKKDVIKMGYMKKLKTMKKKFFILRGNGSEACLEYHDSGKKWKNGQPPKRNIILKNCFNINRRTDTKQKHVIALFTKSDCFSIVLDSEEDLEAWLKALLECQQGNAADGQLKPHFEHVWRVIIQKKELANKYNLSGYYLLCLTDCSLSLIKPQSEESAADQKSYDFVLSTIRRCGSLDSFFYMELGQASCLGSGNLWMQVEDGNIALNMHSVIMSACSNCPKKEIVPKSRSRSSSANETSKPVHFGRKWFSGDEGFNSATYSKSNNHQEKPAVLISPNAHNRSVGNCGDTITSHHAYQGGSSALSLNMRRRASVGHRPAIFTSSARINYNMRERCDSLPSRGRMHADSFVQMRSNAIPHINTSQSGNSRPISMYSSRASNITSPGACTATDSSGSSLSVDVDGGNLSESDYCRFGTCAEEGRGYSDDYIQWGGNLNKQFLAGEMNPKKFAQSGSPQSSYSFSPFDNGAYVSTSNKNLNSHNKSRQQLNASFDSIAHHSRESSIYEDGEGPSYIAMAPLSSSDTGYLSDQRKTSDISPGLSSSSITSDARLQSSAHSCLTPSDEEGSFNVRSHRAYSTGSKPEDPYAAFSITDDDPRTRAFSCGSRCGPAQPSSFMAKQQMPAFSSVTSAFSLEACREDFIEVDFGCNQNRASIKDAKSSTDPYLEMCFGGDSSSIIQSQSPPRTKTYLGMGRCSPASMFYTCPKLERVLERPVSELSTSDSPYVDMLPGVADLHKPRSPPPSYESSIQDGHHQPLACLTNATTGDYIDMRIKDNKSDVDPYVEMVWEPKGTTTAEAGKENNPGRKKSSLVSPAKQFLPLNLMLPSTFGKCGGGGIRKKANNERMPVYPNLDFDPSCKCAVDATSGSVRIVEDESDDSKGQSTFTRKNSEPFYCYSADNSPSSCSTSRLHRSVSMPSASAMLQQQTHFSSNNTYDNQLCLPSAAATSYKSEKEKQSKKVPAYAEIDFKTLTCDTASSKRPQFEGKTPFKNKR